jgi:hypothetical protein
MKRVLALLLLTLVGCDNGPAGPGDPTSPIPALPLNEATLLRHLGVLAHDSMGGRLAGSPQEGEAARYILLAQQWVIIGAHYDHVGYDQVAPDSILVYNGADDNASGTALLMEIARYLSDHVSGGNMAGMDRRSVMFQAYGAEERAIWSARLISAGTPRSACSA